MPDRTWIDLATTLLSCDAENFFDVFRKILKPGIISTNSHAFSPTVGVNDTQIVFDDFADGEAVFTNNAICTEFYEQTMEFTVNDATGYYWIYLDAHDPDFSPHVHAKYGLWPRKTLDPNKPDENKYVIVTFVYWDAAQSIVYVPNPILYPQPERPFGVIDLAEMGKGLANKGIIRDGQTLTFRDGSTLEILENAIAKAFAMTIQDTLKIDDNGNILFGDHGDLNAGNDFRLGSGSNTVFDIGKNSSLNIKDGSQLTLGILSMLAVAANSYFGVGADSLISIGNNCNWGIGNDNNINVANGTKATFGDTASVKMGNGLHLKGVSTGKPEPYTQCNQNVITAHIRWENGQIVKSFNIASCVVTSVGIWTITFDRKFTTDNYIIVPGLNHLSNPIQNDGGGITTADEGTDSFKVICWNDVPGLVDWDWSVIVVGGTLITT